MSLHSGWERHSVMMLTCVSSARQLGARTKHNHATTGNHKMVGLDRQHRDHDLTACSAQWCSA